MGHEITTMLHSEPHPTPVRPPSLSLSLPASKNARFCLLSVSRHPALGFRCYTVLYDTSFIYIFELLVDFFCVDNLHLYVRDLPDSTRPQRVALKKTLENG